MSRNLKQLAKGLVLLVCLSPLVSWSQNASLAIGTIEQVSSNTILIGETRFKVLPTAKIYLANKKEGSLENLSKGDYIRADLLKINRVNQIETVYIYDNPEQLFQSLGRN